MNVVVIGAGYVGLTTAVCLGTRGNLTVSAIDTDSARIADYRAGRLDAWVKEPGLRACLTLCRDLTFHNDYAPVKSADVAFLCVPTPQTKTGAADLTYVLAAMSLLTRDLPPDAVVVMKSTAPVGTAQRLRDLCDENGREDLVIGVNPEFLREGHAIADFMNPERVVIGGDCRVREQLRELYSQFDFHDTTAWFLTSCEEAELIKYASNAFLATKVSFANELAWVCGEYGADSQTVLTALGADSRVGSAFLKPGPGWGGSCFPKDTAALLASASWVGRDLSIVRAAVAVNQKQVGLIEKLVRDACDGDLVGKKIAVWGLTFKAGVADVRDSTAVQIVEDLIAAGAIVRAYDPEHGNLPALSFPTYSDPIIVVEGVQVLLVLTEDESFKEVHLEDLRLNMWASPVIVDARNTLDRDLYKSYGFRYVALGR